MSYPKFRKPTPPFRKRAVWVWLAVGLFGLIADVSLTLVHASSPRELKRTARSLRVSPDTLRQARQFLREATDLSLQLPTLPSEQLPALAMLWSRINAPEAPAQAERLFRALRAHSEQAEGDQVLRTQSALAGVLHALSRVDPERAWTLSQQWPPVQETVADVADSHTAGANNIRMPSASQFRLQAQSAIIAALAACDPDRASTLAQNLLSKHPNALADQFSMLSMMLYSQPELTTQVAQEAIKAYKDQPLTKNSINNYVNLLQRLAWMDPDMVGPTAQELAHKLKSAEAESLSDRPLVLRSQDTSVQLDGIEPQVYGLLKSLRTNPTVMMKILAEFPGLEAKLNQIGGPDILFRPGSRSMNKGDAMEEDLTPPHKRKDSDDPMSISRSFYMAGTCPKESKRMQQSRAKLQELATKESGFDQLVSVAQNLSYQNPDLAEEALRLAQPLADEAPTPAVRAERLARLVVAYATLDNEIDSNLLEKAFAAMRKMSEPSEEQTEEAKPAHPLARDRGTRVQEQLFFALAQVDLKQAMDRARALPNDPQKLSAMVGILQTLGAQGTFGYEAAIMRIG